MIGMLGFVVLLCHSPLVKSLVSFGYLGFRGLVKHPFQSAWAASAIGGLKTHLGILTGGRIHLRFKGFARYLELRYSHWGPSHDSSQHRMSLYPIAYLSDSY